MALAILAGIFYIVLFYDFGRINIFTGEKKETPVQEEAAKPVEEIVARPIDEEKNLDVGGGEIEKSAISAESLKRIALSFAERFGSYSNHSNYSNILDLKIFMTDDMRAWADKFVQEAKVKDKYSDIYYGTTTKAILVQEKKFDEDTGQAVFLVKTQRRESMGDMGNASTIYQDVLLFFVKERDSWKVDKAEWQ